MPGKFINTEIVNSLDSIVNSFKDRLANPLYNFNQEKGTVVTYYNTDLANLPLDTVTGMQYSSIGNLSTTKYNKISNFVIYGLERVAITINNTEDGTEAEEISGDAIILPNTIHPYVGDFFTIDMAKEKCLFRVIDAQSDTFDNDANVWQIRYQLEHWNNEELEKYNIGNESHFVMTNVGTQYNPVILDSIYHTIETLEEILDGMREYYVAVFFSNRVNSLIFSANGNRFYDSYLTEFVIRNKLLESRKDFIMLQHQIDLPDTFSLDYSRSFFYIVESKKIKKFRSFRSTAFGELIDSKVNIFSTRPEPYLSMNYMKDATRIINTVTPGLVFEIFDKELIHNILTGEKFENDILSNIIIKYFNDEILTEDDIEHLDNINFKDNIQLFYYVPVAMYIIEAYIKQLMLKEANK